MRKNNVIFTDDGMKILEDRFLKNNPARRKRVERYRKLMEIGQQVYDLREAAGLSQSKLANITGLTPSLIADLEDAEYHGNAQKMLDHIADCLNKNSTTPAESKNKSQKRRAG